MMNSQQGESEAHTSKIVNTANTSQMSSINQNQQSLQQLQEIKNTSEAQLSFRFNVTMSQISDMFEEVAEKLGYDMIEKQSNHATAIKQSKKSIMQMLNCFNWWGDSSMTAIKMTVHTNQKQSTRVCRVRGLVGSRRQVKIFIDLIHLKSKDLMTSSVFFGNQQSNADMSDQISNPFHLQTCAAYMFHKILSNSQYGIGSILASSIKNLKSTYAEPEKRFKDLPIPMKTAAALVNQVVENLYKQFNYGRKQMEQIMPYCRISVEKYIFEEISDTIFPLYLCKTKQANEKYNKKRGIIIQRLTLKQIFTQIHLENKYWKIILNCQSQDSEKQLNSIRTFEQWRTILKLKKSIQQLQKVQYTKNPRQKVKYFQLMYTSLKTTIYECSKGKDQLNNMQDIIPMTILTVLMTDIPNLKANIEMINDFSANDNCSQESQSVGRMLVNISESFNYIERDWKMSN